MSFLETIFPMINEILVPIILILIGLIIAFLGGLIPLIGGKIRAIGLLSIFAGVIWYFVNKNIDNFLVSVSMSTLFGIVMAIILIIIAVILFVDRK